ncbi:MAG: hypothetical protein HKN81_02150 [Gammaproteobacteria bacterium]|nr:hypothetical protein [Gammaproteobacteria bacterium]
MLQDWATATLAGTCLGLAWFACVRLRMHVGPIVRERYGDNWRRAYWLLTIIVMIVLANVGLRLLRSLTDKPENMLLLEIWFACLAVLIAFTLIFRRLRRRR